MDGVTPEQGATMQALRGHVLVLHFAEVETVDQKT